MQEISEEIEELNNLWWLDLSFNQMQEIPKKIGNLENLKDLYLRENPLNQEAKEFLEELKKKGVFVDY